MTGGVFLATSCQFLESPEEELQGEPLARVYNRYLYKSDVLDLIPDEMTETDSLAFLQNYINVWAKDQLMIYKAEYNLTESQKNFDKQIEEYRNDLLKFAYQQEYIHQNLDTVVADSTIYKNYQTSSNDFKLKENIVKANYVIVNKEAPDLKKAIKWFSSTKPQDEEDLHDFAIKYAYRYSLSDSSWMEFDNLKKLIPFGAEDEKTIISNPEVYEFADATNVYLVKIWAYKLKGDRAPLAYSKEIINNILLNQRKLILLKGLEQKLLEDALEKKEFEVY